MAAEKLAEYDRKRDFARTDEPAPDEGELPPSPDGRPRFVVQEHHARALHWDFRLERDGVGVSWAVPKGLPPDPGTNHLAVPTEDHPLSYFAFEGEIPKGEYGGGTVTIWDRGTYDCVKWSAREVMVDLYGERVQGRYVLFRTGDRRWMIHRMSPPQDADREPFPESVEPMKATLSDHLPSDDANWAYEVKWDGYRTVAFVRGGRVGLQSRTLRDITDDFPELRKLGLELTAHEVVLDGEVVALDESGRPSFGALQQRGKKRPPVVYMVFDLLYLDGRSTCALPYLERRRLLDGLGIAKGPNWQVPAHHVGDGQALLDATRAQGLEGLVAKRVDSPYEPGRRSRSWLKLKNVGRQELVVGGWLPGEGSRATTLGALLVGYHDEAGDGGPLRYAGRVGTGFNEAELRRLMGVLAPIATDDPPFADVRSLPPEVRKHGRWVRPEVVVEVGFNEWTHTGTLRAPRYFGQRDDRPASEVVRET